ncbi:hypothetical protein [Bradyrhizobium sp. STM 3562]|uniref:hypothetical protein n=1 Tax=Bradyrhizobium sp. STM 3562 TaxID=578924 RepID=UPI00388FEA45
MKFDQPIRLANRKLLRTLRDAGEYAAVLPTKEAALERWQLPARCLLAAAEGKGLVMMARIAMLQALTAEQAETALTPRKKPAKKYRIIR